MHLFLLRRFGIDSIEVGTYSPIFVKEKESNGYVTYYRRGRTTRQILRNFGMGLVGKEPFKQYCRRHADEWREATAIPEEDFADRDKRAGKFSKPHVSKGARRKYSL